MARFRLEIITPERQFFDGEVESLVIDTPDGKRGIMARHLPMVVALSIGAVSFKSEGIWKTCFASEGFVEVRPDETIIYAQVMEWPDEIDEMRAEEARTKAEEHLRQEQSLREYTASQASLIRAMTRLRVKRSIDRD